MQYRSRRAWIAAVAIAATGGAPADAAEPPRSFSYSHVEIAYDLDATVELHGGGFDSDDSYSAGISYLVHPAIYLFGSADRKFKPSPQVSLVRVTGLM
jgi:hypothetical protein